MNKKNDITTSNDLLDTSIWSPVGPTGIGTSNYKYTTVDVGNPGTYTYALGTNGTTYIGSDWNSTTYDSVPRVYIEGKEYELLKLKDKLLELVLEGKFTPEEAKKIKDLLLSEDFAIKDMGKALLEE